MNCKEDVNKSVGEETTETQKAGTRLAPPAKHGRVPRASAPAPAPHPRQQYLVLLVLLQQLAPVPQKLLQAQLGLPALPHTLGEVRHQAAGTGEQSLGPVSAQHPEPREPGQAAPPHWASVSPPATWTPLLSPPRPRDFVHSAQCPAWSRLHT